jgi:type I restriction enzyme S subunit
MKDRGWTSVRLGDVCTKIGSGATPRGGSDVYLKVGPYALIRSQNVYNSGFHREGLAFISEKQAAELENVEVLEGDILLNITGDSVARVCQVDPKVLPARVNQHVAIIRPDPSKLVPRFLRYYLVLPSIQAQLLSWAGSGGTRNALTKGMIESLEVLAPTDVAEQRAIADVIGTLDDKIALNQRMNGTLEAIARAIFKSWFVDFDPVRAKIEGCWRKGESLPGLPAHLFNLFPDRLIDSELGEIPEGWEVRKLAAVSSVITKGTTPTKQDIDAALDTDVQVSYVRVNAIGDDGTILYDKLIKIPESVHLGVLKRSVLCENDVLYTIAGTIGRASVVEASLLPANVNQAVAIIRPASSIPSDFLTLMMRQTEFRGELHSNIVHAVQANLSLGVLSESRAVFPPEVSLPLLFKPIEDIMRLAKVNRVSSRTLAALRDALLPKLVSGELALKYMPARL